eukprot:CAMPEP_0183308510 /NCGR_PEP_ID=MMETSP0160_2-20130417/22301_1 /TAXON_ID=2839 ORGANISM="Odontella Sinensis, Strain Grunow 1884" /NCGR_SAMPLE_ID=MMETSP0160_2 /ASSEMBLY_ACC=CAM_ASM_000250 /LENGTH=237 /DNA_ID=CAMNT_0025472365 /DNA_START=72 /DNA_END=782 /DNA_ORIENTATION=-
MGPAQEEDSAPNMDKPILEALRGSEDGRSMDKKELRKLVFLSVQVDEDDKSAKKALKKTLKALEDEGKLKVKDDGTVQLSKSEAKGKKKGKKKEKKKRARGDDGDGSAKKAKKDSGEKASEGGGGDDDDNDGDGDGDNADENETPAAATDGDGGDKNKPCKGNPQGVTRLFVGNLPYKVDEASLKSFLSAAGEMTHVKWITDSETGKFYGSSFVEMAHSKAAAAAVAMAGSDLMGRE